MSDDNEDDNNGGASATSSTDAGDTTATVVDSSPVPPPPTSTNQLQISNNMLRLKEACRNGLVDAVRQILGDDDKHANVLHATDRHGMNASDDDDDSNSNTDDEEDTASSTTSSSSTAEIVQLLLDAGVNVHAISNAGFTALHFVRSAAVAQLLLQVGSSAIHRDNDDYQTPLHCACEYGRLEVAKVLLDAMGSSRLVRQNDRKGGTPLHWAVKANSIQLVRLLHSCKAVIRERYYVRSTVHPAAFGSERGACFN